MLSSTKTTAERPSCPYAHAWPSPGVDAAGDAGTSRTLLPICLMAIELGDVHQRHRHDLMPLVSSRAVQGGMPVIRELSQAYVDAWRAGRHVHGDLKTDLLHWSAHCLGAAMFGEAWDRTADLAITWTPS